MDLVRGFRCKLEEYLDLQQSFQVKMETVGDGVYDTCCFGLDQGEKISDERYVVFYNQKFSPERAIGMEENGDFTIELSKLPRKIEKLAFTTSIDGEGTLGQIREYNLTISQHNTEIMKLHLTGSDFHNEKTMIGIEIYRKSVWRLGVTANGFDGGLERLLTHYGGEMSGDDESTALQPQEESQDFPQAQEEPQRDSQPQEESQDFPQAQEEPQSDSQPREESQDFPQVQEEPQSDSQPREESQELPQVQEISQNNSQSQRIPQNLPKVQEEPQYFQQSQGNRPVSLQKGQKVVLKKADQSVLHKVTVGLGWDMAKTGTHIDCDASAFLCVDGKLGGSSDVVCYANLRHVSGAVRHRGDNLTGAGDGDDEQIVVNLDKLPERYDRIVFVVNIFWAGITRQHFGKIRNCFIRICDDKEKEFCRYNLSENYDKMTAMIFGEMVKENGIWSFHAIGEATQDKSITALKKRFK